MTDRRLCTMLIAICAVLLSQFVLSPMAALGAEETVSFSIGDGVTAEDESYVREGIAFAQAYIDQTLLPFPPSEIVVNVRNTRDTTGGQAAAFSGGRFIVVFTRSPGWKAIAPFDRVHVVVHEYVHSWQRATIGRDGDVVPLWLMEGTAEFLSYDAVARGGLVRPQEVLDAMTWSVLDAPGMAALDELETRAAFYGESGPAYSLAYLAVAALVDDGGPAAIDRFFTAVGTGMTWQAAFVSTFDQDVDSFYQSFARARNDLIAPRDMPEPFVRVQPKRTESPIALSALPGSVAADEQITVIGKSEPGATCTLRLRSDESGERLTRTTFADGAGRLFWLITIPPEFGLGPASLSANCGGSGARGDFTVSAAA